MRRKEETVTIDLLHRAVPARYTDEGLRALSGEMEEKAYALYEKFKPEIPPGKKGWGASALSETVSSSQEPQRHAIGSSPKGRAELGKGSEKVIFAVL